jgi:hypothetical protein
VGRDENQTTGFSAGSMNAVLGWITPVARICSSF